MISIANHTFLPHAADWSVEPAWRRRWQTGMAAALSGAEQRAALRALPLHTLEFSVLTRSLAERARLDARVDQAVKAGEAAVPFFGYGCGLAANAAVGANEVTLDDATAPWLWAAGDYLSLLGVDDTEFDCWQVTAVAGNTLTLAGNLVNAWPAGVMARPVLFGRFTLRSGAQKTDWHAAVGIQINQLVAERNAQLGAVVPDAGVGVGHDTVGTDNDIV